MKRRCLGPILAAVATVAALGFASGTPVVSAAPAAAPVVSSGVYAVTARLGTASYPSTWTLRVTRGKVTGVSRWTCCPGARTDRMTGTANGSRVVIVRDCSGQGMGACKQTYIGIINAKGLISGKWSGSYDGPNATWSARCTSGACARAAPASSAK